MIKKFFSMYAIYGLALLVGLVICSTGCVPATNADKAKAYLHNKYGTEFSKSMEFMDGGEETPSLLSTEEHVYEINFVYKKDTSDEIEFSCHHTTTDSDDWTDNFQVLQYSKQLGEEIRKGLSYNSNINNCTYYITDKFQYTSNNLKNIDDFYSYLKSVINENSDVKDIPYIKIKYKNGDNPDLFTDTYVFDIINNDLQKTTELFPRTTITFTQYNSKTHKEHTKFVTVQKDGSLMVTSDKLA